MYDEPARPSPTPAPIAPPARARPPPTKAPAVLTADSMVSVATVSPWLVAPCPAQGVYLWCGRAGRSGRELWVCVPGDVGGRVVVGVRVLLVVAAVSRGHAEVQDRQQGEDEGLDRADRHVEELPDDGEEDRQDAADRGGAE